MIFGFLALTLASTTLALTTVTVFNHCPTIINVYNGNAPLATLPPETRYPVDVTDAMFFTSANAEGGKPVRAAISEGVYYYMVADGRYANTGIRIEPGYKFDANGDLCGNIECDSIGCDQAFSSVEGKHLEILPEVPVPPLYRCNTANHFVITFCPSGQFPDVVITFGGNKCLQHPEGATVQIADCNNSATQNWLINPGSTTVRASRTNLCLDAGPNPYDGQIISVTPCDNLPGQQWFYSDDKHIALRDKGFCLDMRDGDTTEGVVQIWTCVSNANQIWMRSAPP